jgi:hypothetical protein
VNDATTPLSWTRKVGFLYPPSLFGAALRATFPRLKSGDQQRSAEEEICLGEYLTQNEA